MEKNLYHITRKEKLNDIMTNGIIPKNGLNSEMCGESDDFVYLTDEKSLPYWYILTGGDTVISVDKDIVMELETVGRLFPRDYSRYSEYRVLCTIPAKYLKITDGPSEVKLSKAMSTLAYGYTNSISDMCYELLRADIIRCDIEEMKFIASCAESLIAIAERIDFWTVNPFEYRSMIMDYSNYGCVVTFSDYYYPGRSEEEIKDAGKRCFEHLPNLKHKILRQAGTSLYQLITKTYAKCVLYPDEIGGFCI